MTNASTESQYAFLAWALSFGVFGFISTVLWITATVRQCCVAPTRYNANVNGVLYVIGVLCYNFMLAFTFSFDELHPAGTVILSLLGSVVMSCVIAVLFSSRYAVLFCSQTKRESKEKADHDATPGNQMTLPRGEKSPDPSIEPVAGSSLTSTSVTGEMIGTQPSRPEQFLRALQAALLPQFVSLIVVWILVIMILHLTLASGCYCSSPDVFTTWASRNAQTAPCARGDVCHTYATVSSHCSMSNVISHFVAENGDRAPGTAALKFRKAGSLAAWSVSSAKGAPVTATQPLAGKLVFDRPIVEDYRGVAQFPLVGLDCDTSYEAVVSFFDGADKLMKESPVVTFRTLPSASSAKPIKFIGGGDLSSDDTGYGMLAAMCKKSPEVNFVWIGGDIAYANNMRNCYRRWDDTLFAMTACTRQDGAKPLLMTASGNHEGGGYWFTRLRNDREKGYTHYTTYFPSSDYLTDFTLFPSSVLEATVIPPEPLSSPSNDEAVYLRDQVGLFGSTVEWKGDPTVTFYRAYIGTVAWLVLDSDTMFTSEDQVKYLNETLQKWSDLLAKGKLSKIVAAYHCPGLPTVRSFDNSQARSVRQNFYPLMMRYNVTLALEHHDHAYKRTFPIGRDPDGTLRHAHGDERGMVFVGDGALGVGGRDATEQWYHARSRGGNAGYVCTQWPNGTVHFDMYNSAMELIDIFDV